MVGFLGSRPTVTIFGRNSSTKQDNYEKKRILFKKQRAISRLFKMSKESDQYSGRENFTLP
jgi:hypothetical protein